MTDLLTWIVKYRKSKMLSNSETLQIKKADLTQLENHLENQS